MHNGLGACKTRPRNVPAEQIGDIIICHGGKTFTGTAAPGTRVRLVAVKRCLKVDNRRLPAEGVVVKDSSGNYRKCDTFTADEEIKIFGNFSDDYFRNFNLTVFGGNIAESGVGIGSARYDAGITGINGTGIIGAHDGGAGLEIGTLNLCTIPQSPGKVKCAYGIKLSVWDRAIVGRVRGYEYDTGRHGRHAYVTFDWDSAGC